MPADSSPDRRLLIAQGPANLWLIENRQPATPAVYEGRRPATAAIVLAGRQVGCLCVEQNRRSGSIRDSLSLRRSRIQISVQGGYHPRWRAEDEIVFLSPDAAMMSVRVRRRADLVQDPPERLFPTPLLYATPVV